MKVFLPDMIKRNSGHIVTIASMAGHVGVTGLSDYCASKFGAIGFDESLRMELKFKNYSNPFLNNFQISEQLAFVLIIWIPVCFKESNRLC